jgi:Flp pilus assembly protein TadD
MTSRLSLVLALCLALPGLGLAQNLKPVPNPDLSKLTPAKNSELREARIEFEKAKTTRTGRELADLYAELGGVYARAGLQDAADVAFENASLLAPNDDRWHYLRGLLARQRGQDAQARALFEKSFKLNPMYLPARMIVAGDRLKGGDAVGARKILAEHLTEHPKEPSVLALLGEIDLREKKYADAVRHLRTALTVEPTATSLYRLLAQAEEGAGNSKATEEAKTRIGDGTLRVDDLLRRRILSTEAPDAPVAAERPIDARTLAIANATTRAVNGKYAEARKALDDVLKNSPKDVELLLIYARIEAASGNPSAALSRARAARAADPSSTVALMALGAMQEMNNDDARARQSYQDALKLNPKLAGAHTALGDLALRTGRSADALAAYRSLIAFEPSNAEVWAHVLSAQFASGQCAAGLNEALANAQKHPRDPMFAELAVRAASTCPAASAEQKKKALADAEKLYRAAPQDAAQFGETYALALAANGKWEDAAQTQGAALFLAVSAADERAVAQYREFYQRFQAKQLPSKPWADSHPLVKPQRPQAGNPNPAPAAAKSGNK